LFDLLKEDVVNDGGDTGGGSLPTVMREVIQSVKVLLA
jgi:hypothetical protein